MAAMAPALRAPPSDAGGSGGGAAGGAGGAAGGAGGAPGWRFTGIVASFGSTVGRLGDAGGGSAKCPKAHTSAQVPDVCSPALASQLQQLQEPQSPGAEQLLVDSTNTLNTGTKLL